MRLIPKGPSVSARVRSHSARIHSVGAPVAPMTPKPPAPETAATSSAVAPAPNPTERIGTSMPRRSHSGVRRGSGTAPIMFIDVTPIEIRFPRPSLMGVVNVTPDSFSDGGVHLDPDVAAAAARRMLAEGAAIVDVGGESTRPGSKGISVDEELRRVVPVLERLGGEVPLSIDTSKSAVAQA